MSYSGNSCRNLFTAIQSERMRNFILNTPALQNAIHREVSGPSQICTQGTYTIDVAGATVVWSATRSGVVSLQPNGSSVTLTKVGSGKVTLPLSLRIYSHHLLAQKCGLVGGICNSTFLYYEDFKSDRQIVLL